MFGPPSNSSAGFRYKKVVTKLHRRVRFSNLLHVFKSGSVLDRGQDSDTHTNSTAKIAQNDVWLLALEKVCRVKGEEKGVLA